MEKPDDILKQMKEDTVIMMQEKLMELAKIVKPINTTKVSYTNSMNFIKDGNFKEAKEILFKIISGHVYLKQFY